ncbi:oxidoreductase [Pseudomonas chlororaphis subsp. aurantiaca]|nr:oxidoreductase [Pseudomonas chlororaphis subsp. aurantiaca]
MVGAQIGNWGGLVTDTMAFAIDSCSETISFSYAIPEGAPIAGITHISEGVSYPVFRTGVPGVGYVIGIRDPNSTQWKSIAPPQTQIFPAQGTWTVAPGTLGFTAQVKFIAIERIKSGVYSAPLQKVATLRVTTRSGKPMATDVPLYIKAFTLTAATQGCSLTQGANQNIRLPSATLQSFAGPQSNSAQSASFSMSLTCDADISVYATMTDATTPSNAGNVLSISPDSTAQGFGLQLFKDGDSSPIKFGPDSSSINTLNQWYVGRSASTGTVFRIPFVAKYIRQTEKTKAGTLKASSTITFSYQ